MFGRLIEKWRRRRRESVERAFEDQSPEARAAAEESYEHKWGDNVRQSGFWEEPRK